MYIIFNVNKHGYLLLVNNLQDHQQTANPYHRQKSLVCTLPPSCWGVARIWATWLPCETTVTGVTRGVRLVWLPSGVTTCVIPAKQIEHILTWKHEEEKICEKYNQYNEICKNKIIKQYDSHFTKSATACAWQRQRPGGGRRKKLQRIVKVCSLWRTTKMYKMVTATVFRGRNPMNKTVR
jgi:uncharacterized protein YktA (UPF0223 family)